VHGLERHGDEVGLWLELIDGRTLADEVSRDGPRGVREAVLIGQDVLPRSHDPLVDALPDEQVLAAMAELRSTYDAAAEQFPTASQFIERAIAS